MIHPRVFAECLGIAAKVSTSSPGNFAHMLRSTMCLALDTVHLPKMHLHCLDHWRRLFTNCPALFTIPMRVPALCARDRGRPVSQHWTPESRNSSFFAVRIRSTIRSSDGHVQSHPCPTSEDHKSMRQRGHCELGRKTVTRREGPVAVLP
jgi:hypothetical protein